MATVAEVAPPVGPACSEPAEVVEQLVRPLPALARSTPNEQVMRFWSDHPEQEIAAVLDGDRPVGLLTRHGFMEAWARPFQREVFARKPCDAFMDRQPLVVEVSLPVPELAARAVRAGARVLRDGFIACRGGRYAGVGTGFSILEASAAAEAARSAQLRANVDYASLIQRSQLEVSAEALAAAWPDHALRWVARDVVGGDCFLFRARPEGLFGAVLDCTGHGVSGAFMTLITLAALERTLDASGDALPDPGAVLGALNVRVKLALGQRAGTTGAAGRSDDGCDGACFVIPSDRREVRYAGARLPLLVATEAGVEALQGSRTSIGYRSTPDDQAWQTSRVALPQPGALVLVTDGVTDQVGGPRRIPFGRKRLAASVARAGLCGGVGMLAALERDLEGWQGSEPRRDDLTALVLATGRAP